MPQFLDFFVYSSVTFEDQNHVFHYCFLLKPMGDLPKGSSVKAISLLINFYLWDQNDNMIEDVAMAY